MALLGGFIGGRITGQSGPGSVAAVVIAAVVSAVLTHEAAIITFDTFFTEPLTPELFTTYQGIWVAIVTVSAPLGFFGGVISACR